MKNYLLISALCFFVACATPETDRTPNNPTFDFLDLPQPYYEYANQSVPDYITKDNSGGNSITNSGATLGRVLFYDKQLSANRTISCSSCHQVAKSFSDQDLQSVGLDGGLTGRHSMRLINARFADEVRFFWDERATSLEDQSTQPIQDHVEMGFSGENDQPGINDLIDRMEDLSYYKSLFADAFGDSAISESRMQLALAQFIRSIQSFDSPFDEGLAVNNGNPNADFTNFTPEENLGKRLFLLPPDQGGAGCAGCHRPPEFDIDPNSGNNGVIGVAGQPEAIDLTNTRAPSLRNVAFPDGHSNGPFMHDGSLSSLMDVVDHYNAIPDDERNTALDRRLRGGPGGATQNLNLTETEKEALVVFLQTLSGTALYADPRWSDPFQ